MLPRSRQPFTLLQFFEKGERKREEAMIDDQFRPTFNPISRSVLIDRATGRPISNVPLENMGERNRGGIVINSIKRKDSLDRAIFCKTDPGFHPFFPSIAFSLRSVRVCAIQSPFFLISIFIRSHRGWRVGGDAIDFSRETRRRNANIYIYTCNM